jgi:hypothetical protein
MAANAHDKASTLDACLSQVNLPAESRVLEKSTHQIVAMLKWSFIA